MAADHEMRPECAEVFGRLVAKVENLETNDVDARTELRRMQLLMMDGFTAVRADVSTLKERARNWGIIGGLISSTALGLVAAIVLSVLL